MEDTPLTPDQLSPAMLPHLSLLLLTPDQSMEDTPPTPDPLSPAMLPDQLFPPLDTLPTPDQSMEDTPATMAREMLKLNQRLMPNTLDTLDSMEDTPPMPDPLSPLSTPDLLSSV